MIARNGEVVRDEAHRYWLTTGPVRRELVGVSAVLKGAGFSDATWFTAESRDRGHLVHHVTEEIDAGGAAWHRWTMHHAEIEGYGRSYEQFIEEHRPRWFLTEAIVYDPILGYAGTLDRFGIIDDDVLILGDFKSGATQPAHGPQTAAYRRGLTDDIVEKLLLDANLITGLDLGEARTIKRFTIELQRDGSRAKLVPHTKPDDQVAFLAALNCHNWREKHVRRPEYAHA